MRRREREARREMERERGKERDGERGREREGERGRERERERERQLTYSTQPTRGGIMLSSAIGVCTATMYCIALRRFEKILRPSATMEAKSSSSRTSEPASLATSVPLRERVSKRGYEMTNGMGAEESLTQRTDESQRTVLSLALFLTDQMSPFRDCG